MQATPRVPALKIGPKQVHKSKWKTIAWLPTSISESSCNRYSSRLKHRRIAVASYIPHLPSTLAIMFSTLKLTIHLGYNKQRCRHFLIAKQLSPSKCRINKVTQRLRNKSCTTSAVRFGSTCVERKCHFTKWNSWAKTKAGAVSWQQTEKYWVSVASAPRSFRMVHQILWRSSAP